MVQGWLVTARNVLERDLSPDQITRGLKAYKLL